MIPVIPEVIDAHRQDLLAAAAEHRRGRGESDAPVRRTASRWTLHRAG